MGQANCCSSKDPDEQIDMKEAKKRDEEKKKKKDKRLSEKKKQKTKKKGAMMEEPVVVPEPPRYDESDANSLLPDAPTLEQVNNNKTHHAYLVNSRAKAIEYFDELSSEDWKLQTEAEDVELSTREVGSSSDTSISMTRRSMRVHRSINDVVGYLQDLDKEKAAKYNCDKLGEVKDLSHDSRIVQMGFKGSILMSARDFCYCNTKYELKNGWILIVNHSVESDDVPKGTPIRGVYEGIYLIKQESENQTLVSNVTKIDMKGNVPANLVNKMIEKQHDEFVTLKEGMEH